MSWSSLAINPISRHAQSDHRLTKLEILLILAVMFKDLSPNWFKIGTSA